MNAIAPYLKELGGRGLAFLVNFITAVVIFAVGWLVAKFLTMLIVKMLKALRIDAIAEETKVAEFLRKGGIKYTLSELVGVVVYWIIILGVLISVLDIIALIGVSALFDKILSYLPNVIGAIIILILGIFVSAFVATIVKAVTANLGLNQASLLAKVTQAAIIVFTVIVALDKLQIGAVLVSAVNIVIAASGLALALAFGLGSKEIAGKLMAEWIEKLKNNK